MSSLVNRLATLSRMDEEKAAEQLAELDLSEIVSETVSESDELAGMYGKTLTAELEPGIRCRDDAGELRQLAAILLDNAVILIFIQSIDNINRLIAAAGGVENCMRRIL